MERVNVKDFITSYSIYFKKMDDVLERLSSKYVKRTTTYDIYQEKGDISASIVREAMREIGRSRKTDSELLAELMSHKDELKDDLIDEMVKDSDRHTYVREPMLRQEIMPYIEDAVKVAIGAGAAPNIWALAVDYGMSEDCFRSDGGWVYEPEDNLSEEDKEALRQAAEYLYGLSVFFLYDRNTTHLGDYLSLHTVHFSLFPLGGMSLEEMDKISMEVDKIFKEEYPPTSPDSEEGDLYTVLPFVISRIDEAIYTSIAYSGDDYIQYIRSLSAEDDWDMVNGGKYGSYASITRR